MGNLLHSGRIIAGQRMVSIYEKQLDLDEIWAAKKTLKTGVKAKIPLLDLGPKG